MMGMAIRIVTPDEGGNEGGAKDVISAGYTFIEEFPGIAPRRFPVEVLRAAVMKVDAGMRELANANNTRAPQEATA